MLLSGTHPLGSYPLVVRLSAPESHESQRLLTQKGVSDSHLSHCHRQQSPAGDREKSTREGRRDWREGVGHSVEPCRAATLTS